MERQPEEENKTNELNGREELLASSLANIRMARKELFTGNTDALSSSLIYQSVVRL